MLGPNQARTASSHLGGHMRGSDDFKGKDQSDQDLRDLDLDLRNNVQAHIYSLGAKLSTCTLWKRVSRWGCGVDK